MKMRFFSATMWLIFASSFKKNLSVLEVPASDKIMKNAKKKYKEIIGMIPPFGKNDILLVNLLSAATAAAVYLSLPKKPSVAQMKEYYEKSMDNNVVMRFVLKNTDNFSAGHQKKLAKEAALSQNAVNPYTWRYQFIPGKTLNTFDAIFDKCGICELFKVLNIAEITPALCAYDYGMAKHTNTIFTREFTLASGGAVCDCHYRKNRNTKFF